RPRPHPPRCCRRPTNRLRPIPPDPRTLPIPRSADPMTTPAPSAAGTATGVLLATCLSTLVVNANTSAVSILLPAISEDTGMSVTTLQWAVTGYSLVGAAVIVTSGALGDVFGRKRVFQLGLLLFVASCVLIALAQTGELVIAGR